VRGTQLSRSKSVTRKSVLDIVMFESFRVWDSILAVFAIQLTIELLHGGIGKNNRKY
jgi:hypothetical protein